ncbi:hypothetical protein DH2020_009793 [Rehmannia glutinosa]|uniref:Glucosamine/galactosamine-6-phosphate isomerase domain-containing protein n=1 Tax=Rehmannia glutinosa TaxID=99300 RepID=A0ABR0X9S6_REHGL
MIVTAITISPMKGFLRSPKQGPPYIGLRLFPQVRSHAARNRARRPYRLPLPQPPQRCEKKHWVTSILDSPKPPERITMTFPLIKCASNIAMVVTGKELADPVAKTLGGNCGCAPPPPIPCSELQMEAEGEVTWILDKGAASKL